MGNLSQLISRSSQAEIFAALAAVKPKSPAIRLRPGTDLSQCGMHQKKRIDGLSFVNLLMLLKNSQCRRDLWQHALELHDSRARSHVLRRKKFGDKPMDGPVILRRFNDRSDEVSRQSARVIFFFRQHARER